MTKINLHLGDWITNDLPDKSVQLIIADPPYFETKGDFDFIWDSFDDYLNDVEKWAKECKRILADNGTLYWYGSSKRIAYSQVIFDRYFNLQSNITIEFNRQTKKNSTEDCRTFINVTERLLMYDNEKNKTGLQEIYDNPDLFQSIKKYMRDERSKLMKVKGFRIQSEFNKFINKLTNTASVVERHYFADSQYVFPTKEIYTIMQNTGFWQREYEELRREYEELRRPFNALDQYKFDCLKFDQEAHITKNYDHDTVKPETLTRMLILTSSRPSDLVFIPFVGSGTECAMAIKEGRKFEGYEIEEKHYNTAKKRIQQIISTPNLFHQ